MAIAGAVSKVFGVAAIYSLIYNAIPLLLFCIACYYTDSKFQLALAKIMTIGYTLLMLAVYIGLVVEVRVQCSQYEIIIRIFSRLPQKGFCLQLQYLLIPFLFP